MDTSIRLNAVLSMLHLNSKIVIDHQSSNFSCDLMDFQVHINQYVSNDEGIWFQDFCKKYQIKNPNSMMRLIWRGLCLQSSVLNSTDVVTMISQDTMNFQYIVLNGRYGLIKKPNSIGWIL